MIQCGDEELVPDSWEYLCIHEIPRPATLPSHVPPQHVISDPSLQPDHGVPATLPLQPDQVEVPLEFELMDLDIPDLIDIPEDVVSDFNAWTQDMLDYQ